MAKSLIKNTIYKIMLNIFNIIIPIIIGPYVYRILGPELIGRYNYGFSVFTYFYIFAGFGIYNYGLREISRIRNDKEKLSELFTSLFVLGIISNIFVLLVYLGFSFLYFKGTNVFPVLIILSLNIIANIFYVEWANEALENYDFITLKTVVVRTINVIILFIIVKSSKDFLSYVFIMTIYMLVNNFISYIYIRRNIKFNFKGIKIKKHLKYLILVVIMCNANVLYTQFDKVMLGNYVSDISVSYFSLGQNIMGLVNTLILSVVFVTIPRLSNILASNNEKEYLQLLNKVTQTLFIFLFPAAVGMYVLANEIVLIYGGHQYVAAGNVLKIFAFYMIATGIESVLTNQVLYIKKKEKILVVMIFCCGLLNVVMNIIVLKMGFFTEITTMINTVICELILVIVQYIYVRTKLNLDFKLLSMEKLKYLLISLVFVPINYIIRLMISGKFALLFSITLTCSIAYFIILLLIKDKIVYTIIGKVSGRFIKKNR